MNRDTIIDKWEKSSTVIELPDYLLELIELSFNQAHPPSHELLEYLNQKLHYLTSILEAPPFLIENKVNSPSDALKNINIQLLRNILLIIWFQEENIAKIDDKIDFDEWKNKAFISAFFTLIFDKLYALKKGMDLFILAFFSNISLLYISRTFPSIYNGLQALKNQDKINPDAQEKVIGASLFELSSWILEKWGFSPEFTSALEVPHVNIMNGQEKKENIEISKVLLFAPLFAEFVLNGEELIRYRDIDSIYRKLFQGSSRQFQEILVEVLRSLPKQAALFGYSHLTDLSIMYILKDHLDLLDKDLLSYNDLLEEVVKSNKMIVQRDKQIELLQTLIEKQYIKDPITDLFHYSYFIEYLNQKIKEATRYEYPITLILFDIDNFKSFNVEFGYYCGNELLKQIASLIKENIRQSDFMARYEKDEFAVILPYTGLPQSRNVAEKIKRLINNYKYKDIKTNQLYQVTASLGYVSLLPEKKLKDGEILVSLAMKAMKESKAKGGDSITQSDTFA
jgi:diguanylate cyclase (GGDEF)-like protein